MMFLNYENFERLQNVDKLYAKELIANQILVILKEIKSIKKAMEEGEYFNLTAVMKNESLRITITIDKEIALAILEKYLKQAEKALENLEDKYRKL